VPVVIPEPQRLVPLLIQSIGDALTEAALVIPFKLTSASGGRNARSGGKSVEETTNQSRTIESPYLTAAEAAAYLRTTVQGIYALVKRAKIRPMPGSGKLLFTREALDAYLTGRRKK
jgi:excisionase family DNA binding protein